MPANINPIFTLTPNVGVGVITTTYAQVKSDGTSAASGTDYMVKAFTTGANGSYISKVRFVVCASSAATTSVATTLRVYYSTVTSGATAQSDTHLLGEISVPAISASHSTAATPYYELPINAAFPASRYIWVSQHVAQTTNQVWKAIVFGGDY